MSRHLGINYTDGASLDLHVVAAMWTPSVSVRVSRVSRIGVRVSVWVRVRFYG